jgi:ankyrin repeat protein
MRDNSLSVEKLIACGADVHAKTEDEQSALLAATTFGHTQVAKQLMEAGSSKRAAWIWASTHQQPPRNSDGPA